MIFFSRQKKNNPNDLVLSCTVINYRIGYNKITWYLQNNKAHERVDL